jgi:hypothetical protein
MLPEKTTTNQSLQWICEVGSETVYIKCFVFVLWVEESQEIFLQQILCHDPEFESL